MVEERARRDGHLLGTKASREAQIVSALHEGWASTRPRLRDTMVLDASMPVQPGMWLVGYTAHGRMKHLIFGPMRLRLVTPANRNGVRMGWRFFPADRNTAPLTLPDGCVVEVEA